MGEREEANVRWLRRAYELLNAHDLDGLELLFAPEFTLNDQRISFAEWKRQRATFLQAFPDMHCTVEEVFAQGDALADRHTVRMTHLGPFRGIAPTGRRVTHSALELLHFADGVLVEAWDYADMTSLMRQLQDGAPPAPESSGTL